MRLFLRRFLALSGLLLCAVILGVQGVHRATLVVTNTADSGTGSLRQALVDALEGDTIQFDPALNGQTITLTSAELVVDKSITISGPGATLLAVSRDSNAAMLFGIVHVTPGRTVIIEGLTISGGRNQGAGGGIFNDQGTLTINDCAVVKNHSAFKGGGISSSGVSARLTIVDSAVNGNLGPESGFGGEGGGIYNEGTLEIRHSTVSGNRIGFHDPPFFGKSGGGIFSNGTLTISDSTISGNFAMRDGGGIVNYNGTMTITNSTVSSNTVTGYQGGGIENLGPLTITNCTISNNTVSYKQVGAGGGIANNGPLTITNSTISGNSADGGGGGIHNFTDLGGGSETIEIGNSILNAGASGANIVSAAGAIISRGYNLSSDDGGGFLNGSGDQTNTNPMLGPLQNNGGPTFTHGLLTGSPAINLGDPNFAPPPSYDQRGPGYDRLYGGRIDIGSFELPGNILIVTSPANSGAGSLRDTIAAASNADTIRFDAALNGQTITLTSAELVIDKNISISGPGPDLLSVSRGQQASPFRIFRVTPGHTVTIAGLTISNGLAQTPSDRGGGILNDHAALVVNNCALTGNTAGSGGGVFSNGESSGSATLAINSSTVTGNSANFGAGIFSSAASSGIATLTIRNSTLSGNSAGNSGGGVFNEGDNGGTGTVSIDNSTLSGNVAATNGGALLNDGFAGNGTTEITNTTLSGNGAGSSGVAGAVFNQSGNIEIGNTIFHAGQGANLRTSGGTITSRGYNLSSDDGGGFLSGSGDQINTNPMLGPLQNNGGPTFTHGPLLDSPAIDAGDPNFTPPPDFDQRGLGFVRVANKRVNIGALEVQPGAPTPTPPPPSTPTPTPTPITPTPPPCGVTFSENFDGVAAPALPGGWTTSVTGAGIPWITSTNSPASGPNAAFASPAFNIGNAELITPTIAVPAAGGILSFQNLFNLQAAPSSSLGYDGMVLEISVNGGAYTDIIAAGGAFVTGGYTYLMIGASGSPIAGRMAWSGVSAGTTTSPTYIPTSVNLPAATKGQDIRLKWRLATDGNPNSGLPAPGVRIDNIVLTPASCPTPTPTATPSPTATPTPSATPNPAAQAINLSTRMRVQTGENIGIGGFIIAGSAPKNVLLRAIGPSLAQFGVPNVLADPVMELHGPGTFATIINDNWGDDPAQTALILATGLAPTDDLESAIHANLSPGAYTAIVRGNNNATGVALIEVYDLSQANSAKLANISTRAYVSTGDDIVIAGFILGSHSGTDRVVVRGVGPSLTAFGVPDALADPTLELRDSNGGILLANNNWQDDPAQATEITAAGLAPTSPLESGIAASLPPGLYTALLAGLNNGVGNGVVEVYDRGAR